MRLDRRIGLISWTVGYVISGLMLVAFYWLFDPYDYDGLDSMAVMAIWMGMCWSIMIIMKAWLIKRSIRVSRGYTI